MRNVIPNIKKESVTSQNDFNNSKSYCYISSYNPNLKILHLIITRFLIKCYASNGFPKKLNDKVYIQNGIRVINKYLFPSLSSQRCKNFIWILMIGNEANITDIKSKLNLKKSFKSVILYQKDLKTFIKDNVKNFDILITTIIDYDDCIYYDAVNDVRKIININKPILLHGYNTGFYYFESEDKYYYYHYNNNEGIWSIFLSLILVLNKVNDTFTVNDLGEHCFIKKAIIKLSKSFGINQINYDPSIVDTGDTKFIWVRQNYSGTSDYTDKLNKKLMLKITNFNISKFYGN